MIYLVIALLAEAKPFIKHFDLKKESEKPFTIFSSKDYKMVITGIGKERATIATTHLLTRFMPTKNDFLFNIGLCGAPKKFSIGEALMINKIYSSGKTYYPDMLLRHPFKESALTTVEKPQNSALATCVDMESSAIYKTALYFFKTSQLAFLKIVSDHFSNEIPQKESVYQWIDQHMQNFEIVFSNAKRFRQKDETITSSLKQKSIYIEEKLKLSHSQKLQLKDALIYYILRYDSEPSLDISTTIESKSQRNREFELLITSLK